MAVEGDIEELTRNVNNIVRRCKTEEFGVFSYLCLRCHFTCKGRKQLVKHLGDVHSQVISKLAAGFSMKDNFQSLLNKLVMSAPFSVKKSVQANAVKPSAPNPLLSSSKPRAPTQQDSTDNIVEVEGKKIGKGSLPLTLDMMKVIDERLKTEVDCGGIAGRIGKQLRLVYRMEDDNMICEHCKGENGNEFSSGELTADQIIQHVQKYHLEFLENLRQLFPQAQKRLSVHVQKALEQKTITSCKETTEDKVAIKYTLKPSNNSVQNGKSQKRKSSEHSELGKPKKSNVQNSRNGGFDDKFRYREQRLREKELVSKLSSAQLRKLVMIYSETLCTLPSLCSLSFLDLQKKTKIQGSYVDILDFLCLLHEKCVGYYETLNNSLIPPSRSLKIGHVLINSSQAKIIIENGVQSIRVGLGDSKNLKTVSNWNHPEDWKVIIPPGKDLGIDWNKVDDSRLILGAYKYNLDLDKIVEDSSLGFKNIAKDEEGEIKDAFRDRYGYMLNMFIFKGKYNKDIGFDAGNLTPPSLPNIQEDAFDTVTLDEESLKVGDDSESDVELVDLVDSESEQMVEEEDIDSLIDGNGLNIDENPERGDKNVAEIKTSNKVEDFITKETVVTEESSDNISLEQSRDVSSTVEDLDDFDENKSLEVKPEKVTEVEPGTRLVSEPDIRIETEPDNVPKPAPVTVPEPEPVTNLETKLDNVPEPKPPSESELETDSEPKPMPESEPSLEADPELESESVLEPEPSPETHTDAEPGETESTNEKLVSESKLESEIVPSELEPVSAIQSELDVEKEKNNCSHSGETTTPRGTRKRRNNTATPSDSEYNLEVGDEHVEEEGDHLEETKTPRGGKGKNRGRGRGRGRAKKI